MRSVLWWAPASLVAVLGISALLAETTVGPFRLSPDDAWEGPRTVERYGVAGWEFYRIGRGPAAIVHLGQQSVPYKGDQQRKQISLDLARSLGERFGTGFRSDTTRMFGPECVRVKFRDGDETVWRMFPYNAERIFTVTVVSGQPDGAFPNEAKELLATLKMPEPRYKEPKKDLLGGLLGALDNFGKELDKLNDILKGKVPAGDAKPSASGDNKGTTRIDKEIEKIGGILGVGKKSEEVAVRSGSAGEVAVAVPWLKVDESGATESPRLAKEDRIWAPVAASPPAALPGAEPIAIANDLPLADLGKTIRGGHARVAAAGLYELLGPLPPLEAAKLDAKLAPALARPTPETENYFEKLIPLLQEELSLRAAAATAAEGLDAAWEEAHMAAAFGDEEGARAALEIAAFQKDLLTGVQARLAEVSAKAVQAGVTPNPVAIETQAAQEYQLELKAILAAIEEMTKPAPKPPSKTVVWNFSGKVPANWKVSKIDLGIQIERDKVESPDPGEGHWKSHVTASIRVGLPTKVRGADDKPTNAAEAAQMLQKKIQDRVCGFVPSDMAVGLDKQGGMEGVSAFAIGEFKGHIVDYAVWRRRGTWGSGYTASYSGAGGEGWVFADGYRIYFEYRVGTSGCYCNHGLEWENSQAMAVQREARAILAGLNPRGTGVFETVSELPTGDGPNPADAIPDSLRPTIEFHTANIRFLKGNIQRLQDELFRETDPTRRAQLQFNLVVAQSDLMAEEDLIQSALTGQIVHRRSPFEEYAHERFRQSIREDQQKIERFQRAQAALQRLAALLPPGQSDEARRYIASQIDGRTIASLDFAKISQVGNVLNDKIHTYWTGERDRQQAIGDKFALYEQRAKELKWVCDNSLFVMSLFGGQSVTAVYKGLTGYVEGGPQKGILDAAAWCGTPAYVASEAFQGYQRGGWSEAGKEGAKAFLVGKAWELGASKIASWMKGAPSAGSGGGRGLGGGGRPGGSKGEMPAWTPEQLAAFNQSRSVGEATVKKFIEAQKKLAEAGSRGAPAKEIVKLQEAATKAAQAVHETPQAKNFLKFRGDPSVQAAYEAHMRATHATVEAKFHDLMIKKGWSKVEMQEFRNASSKGSVGMDYDIGLNEQITRAVTQNGNRRSLRSWNEEAQKTWDEAYQAVTGRSAKRSWETVTTSQHAEAYKDLAWLSEDKSGIRKAWAQQAADVTRYKNWHMMNDKSLDAITAVQENCRGTAKDIQTKLFALLKMAKPKTPQSAKALQNAQEKWRKIHDTLNKFGRNELDPLEASRRIREITGGRDITQVLDDAAMMIETLGKFEGR